MENLKLKLHLLDKTDKDRISEIMYNYTDRYCTIETAIEDITDYLVTILTEVN